MNLRRTFLALGTLTIAVGTVSAAAMVSAQAVPDGQEPHTATYSVIYESPGGDAIACTVEGDVGVVERPSHPSDQPNGDDLVNPDVTTEQPDHPIDALIAAAQPGTAEQCEQLTSDGPHNATVLLGDELP